MEEKNKKRYCIDCKKYFVSPKGSGYYFSCLDSIKEIDTPIQHFTINDYVDCEVKNKNNDCKDFEILGED